MTRHLCGIAKQLCAGRVVAVQEGGYSLDHMPFCTSRSSKSSPDSSHRSTGTH